MYSSLKFNWLSICQSGSFAQYMNYIPTNFKVSQYDELKFKLIPQEKIIKSCQNMPDDIFFANTIQKSKDRCLEMSYENKSIFQIINNFQPSFYIIFWIRFFF